MNNEIKVIYEDYKANCKEAFAKVLNIENLIDELCDQIYKEKSINLSLSFGELKVPTYSALKIQNVNEITSLEFIFCLETSISDKLFSINIEYDITNEDFNYIINDKYEESQLTKDEKFIIDYIDMYMLEITNYYNTRLIDDKEFKNEFDNSLNLVTNVAFKLLQIETSNIERFNNENELQSCLVDLRLPLFFEDDVEIIVSINTLALYNSKNPLNCLGEFFDHIPLYTDIHLCYGLLNDYSETLIDVNMHRENILNSEFRFYHSRKENADGTVTITKEEWTDLPLQEKQFYSELTEIVKKAMGKYVNGESSTAINEYVESKRANHEK